MLESLRGPLITVDSGFFSANEGPSPILGLKLFWTRSPELARRVGASRGVSMKPIGEHEFQIEKFHLAVYRFLTIPCLPLEFTQKRRQLKSTKSATWMSSSSMTTGIAEIKKESPNPIVVVVAIADYR